MNLSRSDISVVITYFRGDILASCLAHLAESQNEIPFEIIVVCDRTKNDGKLDNVLAQHPVDEVVYTQGARGFSYAGNRGMARAQGKYVVLLNDDVFVTRNWLAPLLELVEADDALAAVGPKILSLRRPGFFDYSGGAGGRIDYLGYPFTYGRLFRSIEKDVGQYGEVRNVFWVSGCAILLRRSALAEVGYFDESLFMQMEEIDLCWRLQRHGYTVKICPSAKVFHYDGYSLPVYSFKKTFLNHRNNLIILVNNLPVSRLGRILGLRIALELITVLCFFVYPRAWRHSLSSLLAVIWFMLRGPALLKNRFGRKDSVGNGQEFFRLAYPRSVVWDYFVRGCRIPLTLGENEPAYGVGADPNARPSATAYPRSQLAGPPNF